VLEIGSGNAVFFSVANTFNQNAYYNESLWTSFL
jgi:hypothetical protein